MRSVCTDRTVEQQTNRLHLIHSNADIQAMNEKRNADDQPISRFIAGFRIQSKHNGNVL